MDRPNSSIATLFRYLSLLLLLQWQQPLCIFAMIHRQRCRAPQTPAFLYYRNTSHKFPSRIISRAIKAGTKGVELEAFDFSSRQGWDDFYVQNREIGGQQTNNDMAPFEYEWHSSIPHEYILTQIQPHSSVLMVGAGNSNLPRVLYDLHNHTTNVECLDYSQPCIDMLSGLHSDTCPGMKFTCGDVKKLGIIYGSNSFDVIVDKGLMDAIMCSEGWNGELESYFQGVGGLLQSGKGKFILVSYKLSSSTREFLLDMGDRYQLKWDFDIDSMSNDRVSFSIALKL